MWEHKTITPFAFAASLLVAAVSPLRAVPSAPGQYALTNTLTLSYYADPTYCDYNNDGYDDFLVWPGPGTLRLVSGRNAALMREWNDNYGQSGNFGGERTTIPDIDGDHKREFLFSAPAQPCPNGGTGAVFALSSTSPGGNVNSLPLTYRIDHPGGFTNAFTLSAIGSAATRNAFGIGDYSRVLITDSATGAIQARLYRSTAAYQSGFGHAVDAVGDVNGDGVQDFAIGDPNVLHSGSVGSGEIYIVSGATTTTGSAYTPVNTLPTLLATMVSTPGNLGAGLGPTFVNLGDPTPNDGVRQQLLVAGTPYANYGSGGFVAFLLSPGGSGLTPTQVALYAATNKLYFGGDTVGCGDLNGDGIEDVAFLEAGDGTAAKRGQILIVSGAGLLDGFDVNADVLQRIADPNFTVGRNLRFLGDYDHNGSFDLEAQFSGPGFQTRIYSAPEPAALALLMMLTPLMTRRRKRRHR